MSTSINGKYKKVATIKKASTLSKTIKNLKSGTKYYFKVVTYKKYKPQGSKSKKTVYSKSSSKVSATIK